MDSNPILDKAIKSLGFCIKSKRIRFYVKESYQGVERCAHQYFL